MARLPGCRRISVEPPYSVFKPAGAPVQALELVELTLDELEAVKLADLEGLYQEEAAERLGVSRQTFGRIIESAHRKIADALVHSKALSIQGGPVEVAEPAPSELPRCDRQGAPGPRGRCRHRRGQP